MRAFLPLPVLTGMLALATGWGCYLWGKGPPLAASMLKAKPEIRSKTPRDLARSASKEKSRNLEAEIRRLMEMKLGSGLTDALQLPGWEFVRTLTLDEVQQALRVTGLEKESGDDAHVIASMLYSRWAELDPLAAMNSLAGPARKQASGIGGNAMWIFVRSDPAAAYRWFQENPELARDLHFPRKMVDTLMSEPPDSVIAKATVLGDEFRNEAARAIAAGMANSEESRATFLAFAATLPEKDRIDAISRMTVEWGRQEPDAALEALDSISDPRLRADTRGKVVLGWSQRDPAGLQEWLQEHPHAADKAEQAELWRRWVTERPEDAGRWLASHGNPPELAAAIVRRIESDIQGRPIPLHPSQAANQEAAIRANFRTWSAAAPEEAKRWLDAADEKTRAVISQGPPPKQQ